MKKILSTFIVCALTFLLPIQAVAQTSNGETMASMTEMTETNIISNNQLSRVLGSVRGRFLSSATIQISDEGNGVLGVYADTLCHENMKDIYVTIFLEIWEEDNNDWTQLNMYEYEWHASSPEEKLSMAGVAFDIENLERRRVYRLRSMHAVRSHGGITEAMMPRTEGIILR